MIIPKKALKSINQVIKKRSVSLLLLEIDHSIPTVVRWSWRLRMDQWYFWKYSFSTIQSLSRFFISYSSSNKRKETYVVYVCCSRTCSCYFNDNRTKSNAIICESFQVRLYFHIDSQLQKNNLKKNKNERYFLEKTFIMTKEDSPFQESGIIPLKIVAAYVWITK